MPNLSPPDERSKYNLYDGKAAFGAEAAEGLAALERELNEIGRHISWSRGDYQE
jgi:biotin synthase